MEKCSWTEVLLAPYAVQYPGEIPKEIANKPFEKDIVLTMSDMRGTGGRPLHRKTYYDPQTKYINDPKLDGTVIPGEPVDAGYYLASRYTPEQIQIGMISQMCLFDLMVGITHPQYDDGLNEEFGEYLQPTLAEDIEEATLNQLSYMTPHFREGLNFREGLIKGVSSVIRNFDRMYPNLTNVLMNIFQSAGGLGTGQAIIDSRTYLADAITGDPHHGKLTVENQEQYRKYLSERWRFVRADRLSETQCLGPFIAKRIHEQAKIAALELASNELLVQRYVSKYDLTGLIDQGRFHRQIAGTFQKLGYPFEDKFLIGEGL